MIMSLKEKMMYSVMKEIYDSGIPMSFKGAMVLKVCLSEAGYTEETRHTSDIDANWTFAERPSAEQMVESLQKALDKAGIDFKVSLYRMYEKNKSAGFKFSDIDTGNPIFTMDVDINKPVALTKIYEVEGIRFYGALPLQMLADKIFAISTDKVFRRIKDVVDIYYLSKVLIFDKTGILDILEKSGRRLESFYCFIYKSEELRHSYEKFRFSGNAEKPSFDKVYATVKAYIKVLLPK